jgi:hypothetical protein
MSEEGLDNLFKEGLSGRDVKFNMDSWRNMEQMLPPETKGGYFSKSTAAIVVGFLFIVSASVFVWSYNQSDTEVLLAQEMVQTDKEQSINDSVLNISGKQNQRGAIVSDKQNVSNDEHNNAGVNGLETTLAENEKTAVLGVDNNANKAQFVSKSKKEKSQRSGRLNKNNKAGISFDLDRQKRSKRSSEEKIAFSENAFTKISGLDELATMSLVQVEEEGQTIFVDVSNGKLPNVDKNVLGFIGGISINESLVGTSNGMSGSEFFGVSYQRYLNGGFSLKSNLLYTSRNQVNTIKTFDKKSYDFGSKTEQKSVSSQRLMYLELPIMVNYGFRNHNIMAGGSFSYLMGGLSKESTTYTSLTEEPRYEDSKKIGYAEGFKPYDIALIAGYEYNFNSKLNLGLRLNYGLLDITDDQYFGTKSFDNNVQFRVYVTYSPFQF